MLNKSFIFSLLIVGLCGISPVYAGEIRGRAVFDAVNEERIDAHMPALAADGSLVRAAQLKADDMATKHYFAHRSPSGWNLWDFVQAAKGSGFWVAGENLAEGFNTNEATVSAWMASPTHRANILDKTFRRSGIGIARDGERLIIVQYFAN